MTEQTGSSSKKLIIVGGGLSGIILALKSTLDNPLLASEMVLMEEKPYLGGRLFFPPPIPSSLDTHAEEMASLTSGPGLEIFHPKSLEILIRYLRSFLSDTENEMLEKHLSENGTASVKPSCYVMRKEMQNFSLIFKGSTELFTKNEAEILNKWLEFGQKIAETENYFSPENTTADKNDLVPLEKRKEWTSLSKSSRDAFHSLFVTLFGEELATTLPFALLCFNLYRFTSSFDSDFPHEGLRQSGLEKILLEVLKARGIEIMLNVRVGHVNHALNEFLLTYSDLNLNKSSHLSAKSVCLCLPHSKLLSVISREYLSGEQSRFIARVQPTSMLFIEFQSVSKLLKEGFSEKLKNLQTRIVFPIEKVQALTLSNDRLLFFTPMNFEVSLAAPQVREAISRIRRATSRFFKDEVVEDLKKGAHIPLQFVKERIVLMDHAYSFSPNLSQSLSIKSSKTSIPHLYCLGDFIPHVDDHYSYWEKMLEICLDTNQKLKNSVN